MISGRRATAGEFKGDGVVPLRGQRQRTLARNLRDGTLGDDGGKNETHDAHGPGFSIFFHGAAGPGRLDPGEKADLEFRLVRGADYGH